MQYLPEHAAPEIDSSEGETYQPSDEDRKDIRLAEKAFEQNKKFKGNYDGPWNNYYNMYRGRQWKEKRPSYRHSEVVNLIFREVQATVPIVLDSRPKFEYLPQEPNDIELAEIINQVAEADWAKYNWSEQLTEIMYDSAIIGTGLGGMPFDPHAENGQGAICFDSEDPFYHFPSPAAKDVNKMNKAHVKAEPMPLDEIKKRWPNGKFVTSDVINIKKMDVFDKDRRVRATAEPTVLADDTEQMDASEEKQALVITVYLDSDCEIEEKPEESKTDDGQLAVKFVQQKKYPNGRMIVIANKVLLETKENPYEDGKYPFARVQNYVNQRQFWGISDVEQLESPQKIFNKLVSFSLDVLTLMGNPIWVVGEGSGIDTDNLINSPGLVVETTDMTKVRREEGVSLQPYVLQLIDRMKLWFDDVSGNSDVSRGVKPEGVTAASAIQSLQEATQTRLRQKSRNLDPFLQNIGQMYASRVFQFYTAPRIFRLTGKDGAMRFFKFHVENLEDGKKQVRYSPFEQTETGQIVQGAEKVLPVNGTLDLKVNTGSALGFVKEQNKQTALNLFDRQVIDEEELLKAFDYPNWEAVLQRVMERKAQMAEAQSAPPAAA